MPDQYSNVSGVERAAPEVAALAAERAVAAEAARLLDPEVVAAIRTAGFARHFVPVEHGGSAASFAELARALVTIGTECPATAWCASLAASLARMAAYLPEEGRKEIWRDGPDTLVVGAVSPKGKAHPEDGGWRVSGTWAYVSAVDHSDWALVHCLVPTDGRPERRMFALPRSAYRVEATWSDIGMQATGSNTLIVEDVFVPEPMSFAGADLLAGQAPAPAARCHQVPLPAVNGLYFSLPVLGAAQGALRHWSAYAVERIRNATAGAPGPVPSFYEETLARSSADLDAAWLILERVARTADKGASVTALETARNQRDTAYVADLLVGAVDRLFRASGTGGHSTDSPLQRLWRDVHSATGHVVLQFGPSASAYTSRALDPTR